MRINVCRLALLLSALAVTAAPIAAQFDNFSWTLQDTAPNGGVQLTPTTMIITGNDYPEFGCINAVLGMTAVAPYAGTVVARMDFQSLELGRFPGLDWPVYLIDGVVTKLPEDCDDCEIVFSVSAGATFGFGVQSKDCCCMPGPGVATLTGFRFFPKGDSSTLAGGAPFDLLGTAVAGPGDVDGDGVPDVALGAPLADNGGADSGRVIVRSGAFGNGLFAVDGQAAGDQFGSALAQAGDVNGDHVPDILVGAPRADGAGMDSGKAYVISGAGGGVLLVLGGDAAGDHFGSSVSGPGDVDGDDVPDVLVGAPDGAAGAGYARLHAGAGGASLLTIAGAAGDRCGAAVGSAGDVDGDSVPDLLVGSPASNLGFPEAGVARVHSGVDGAVLRTAQGASVAAHMGSAVAGVGDANGDGVPDFAAGAPQADGIASEAGSVSVFSGATGQLLFDGFGGQTGDKLGAAVAAAGDVDDDGRPDVVAGAPGASGGPGTPKGTARILSGRDGSVLRVVLGGANGDGLGSSVAGAGDVHGDGRADVLAGAPGQEAPGTNAGDVLLVSVDVTWADLGLGLAGSAGTPRLTGWGLLAAGTPIKLRLDTVPVSALSTLVFGFSQLGLPFKGGVMVPAPQMLISGLLTGTHGVALSATWPGGLPSGLDLFFQFWIADAGGPAGVSASNGVRATVP